MSTNIGLQYFPSGVTHLENKKYKEKSLEETTLEDDLLQVLYVC